MLLLSILRLSVGIVYWDEYQYILTLLSLICGCHLKMASGNSAASDGVQDLRRHAMRQWQISDSMSYADALLSVQSGPYALALVTALLWPDLLTICV